MTQPKKEDSNTANRKAGHQVGQLVTLVLAMAVGFILGQISPRLSGEAGVPAPAPVRQAQTPSVPAQIQDRGPAWLVRCGDRVEGQPRRPCEMVQSISMRETGQRVAEMALTAGYSMTEQGEAIDMIGGLVLVPLGISTEDGLIIRIDDAPQGRQFPIDGCAAQGCQARIAFTGEEARRMARSKTLSLITRNTQGQSVVIPMSLEGFGEAMAEMQERAFAPEEG